jgi:hypothetical protein
MNPSARKISQSMRLERVVIAASYRRLAYGLGPRQVCSAPALARRGRLVDA